MALRDKINKNAQIHLEPGETIVASFVTQTTAWWWMMLGLIVFIIMNRYQPVVVTDRRILVLDSGKFVTTKAKSVVRELPRSTQIGPVSGLWAKVDSLGEDLYIHKRFHSDVTAADAALSR